MSLFVVDFETSGILPRPQYPPAPVGCAVQCGRESVYHAWGHAIGKRTTTLPQFSKYLGDLYEDQTPIFHNAAFDLDVGHKHCGVLPKQFHDTLVLAFLHNPHAISLELKVLANSLLGMPPDEKDELRAWIIANVPAAKKKKSTWGAYIHLAPAELVGKYARGDVLRTKKLFNYLYPRVRDVGMLPAYQQELDIIKVLLEIEPRGVPVNVPRLKREIPRLEKNLEYVDNQLRQYLKAPKLDLDKRQQLAEAIADAKIIPEGEWPLTPTGARSTSYKALEPVIQDKRLVHLISVRGKLATSLRTFARPWYTAGEANNGRIFINWSGVRTPTGNEGSGGEAGARTGRFASNPNLQNPPGAPRVNTASWSQDIQDLYGLLPNVRKWIVPEDGGYIIRADASQQEYRLLAHFEGAQLCKAYNENPKMDFHKFVGEMITAMTGLVLPRIAIKTLNFGILYGLGLAKLADALGVSKAEAKLIKQAHAKALPGAMRFDTQLKYLGRSGQAVETLIGRKYYCEPPRFIGEDLRTFEYKLLNYTIQGSAADHIKQSILRAAKTGLDVRVFVHDEIIGFCGTAGQQKDTLRELQKCINTSVKLRVPMLSDGSYSARSWGDCKK